MFFVFFSLHSGVGLVEMGGIGLGRGGRGGKGREGKGGGGGLLGPCCVEGGYTHQELLAREG